MASVWAWQGLSAQEATTENQSTREDSLVQVVNALSEKVNKVDADNRNQKIWKNRAKYFNLSYINSQTLTNQTWGDTEWKSDFGAAMAFGKTFYLHKKPLFNMIKFGIDATWFDLSYVKYSAPDELSNYESELDLGAHQIDASMHAGLSLTVNPVSHLKAAVYFHYVPTYSMVLIDENFGHGFVSNFAWGASIAYKVISVGIENRWGGYSKYNGLSFDESGLDYDDPAFDDVLSSDKWKMKTKSFRVYLSFRY